MSPDVLVTGEEIVPDEALVPLSQAGLTVKRNPNETLSASELDDALKGVAGYIIGGSEQPLAEHFERADALRVVVFTGTDFRAAVPGWRRAEERGIKLASCPGLNAVAVAESTLMLMLSMARPAIRASQWGAGQDPGPGAATNIELQGKTLGLIGCGHVGSRVAALAARGLGMNVIYNARHPRQDVPATPVGLGELLESADVLSLHRPALAEGELPTLGRAEFAQMRRDAIVIDTAHRSLIDPAALAEAIETKRIRAAVEGAAPDGVWGALASFGPSRFLGFPTLSYSTVEANRAVSLEAVRIVCDVLAPGNQVAAAR